LVVPKPKERKEVIEKMQNEIGHFGKSKTLIEAKRRFFWYEKIRLSKSWSELVINVKWLSNMVICNLELRK
jgi:hypothetical protein